GTNSKVDDPRALTMDANKNLQVGNNGGDSVTSYTSVTNPAGLIGDIAPQRNLQGGGNFAGSLRAIPREAPTALMYVSVSVGAQSIFVFQGASTGQLNGNPGFFHKITSAGKIDSIRGICLDTSGNLYVANRNNGHVYVFANAKDLNGDIAPTRDISS